jgi:hypothetical protein
MVDKCRESKGTKGDATNIVKRDSFELSHLRSTCDCRYQTSRQVWQDYFCIHSFQPNIFYFQLIKTSTRSAGDLIIKKAIVESWSRARRRTSWVGDTINHRYRTTISPCVQTKYPCSHLYSSVTIIRSQSQVRPLQHEKWYHHRRPTTGVNVIFKVERPVQLNFRKSGQFEFMRVASTTKRPSRARQCVVT